MPSSIQLSGYETLLINEYGRENMLRQYVDAARPFYDHILKRGTSDAGGLRPKLGLWAVASQV